MNLGNKTTARREALGSSHNAIFALTVDVLKTHDSLDTKVQGDF